MGVPAHLNWASNVGELLLAGKQGDLEARVHLECLAFLLRGHPLVGSSPLRCLGHFRNVGIVDLCRHFLPFSKGVDPFVAIRRHEIEVPHRRQEVQVAIASVAAARVIKGIEGTVAKEVLAILLHNRGPHLLVQLGSLLAKELLEHSGSE